MKQTYTWRIDVPLGWDVDQVRHALVGPVERMQELNKWVESAGLVLNEDHLLLSLTMVGHDRWWIRKRAPHLIAGLATQSKVGTNMVKHVDIGTPPNLKKAKFVTTDGRRSFVPQTPEQAERADTDNTHPCVKCHDPKYFYFGRGWKTGSQVKWGRGR